MVQKLGNKTCPFCSRHVVACAHQIRRKRTWESLLKTIWGWESQPYQVSNMNHTLSKLPIKLHLLVCQVCCRLSCTKSCPKPRAFSRGFSCTKSCSNACFYSRYIRDLSCAKLCCMVSIMLKVCALVIILVVLWKWKKCGKTKNWRFVLFSSSELRPGSGRS